MTRIEINEVDGEWAATVWWEGKDENEYFLQRRGKDAFAAMCKLVYDLGQEQHPDFIVVRDLVSGWSVKNIAFNLPEEMK